MLSIGVQMKKREPVQVTKHIASSPEIVWGLVTDLTRMGDWSPENKGGNWVKGATRAEKGAKFKGINSNGKVTWPTLVKVIECDPPKHFVFRLLGGPFGSVDWVYDIEPTENGCQVTESWIDERRSLFTYFGGKLTGVEDRAIHNRQTMEATLDALAETAEAVTLN